MSTADEQALYLGLAEQRAKETLNKFNESLDRAEKVLSDLRSEVRDAKTQVQAVQKLSEKSIRVKESLAQTHKELIDLDKDIRKQLSDDIQKVREQVKNTVRDTLLRFIDEYDFPGQVHEATQAVLGRADECVNDMIESVQTVANNRDEFARRIAQFMDSELKDLVTDVLKERLQIHKNSDLTEETGIQVTSERVRRAARTSKPVSKKNLARRRSNGAQST